MNINDQVKYWVEIAEKDVPVAKSLFENGHYLYCLFLGHLIIEKIIKAHYVKDNNEMPPKTHDLVRLITKTKIKTDDSLINFLDELTDFQLETRYPDYKLKLFKMADREFTEKWFSKIMETYQWLNSQLK